MLNETEERSDNGTICDMKRMETDKLIIIQMNGRKQKNDESANAKRDHKKLDNIGGSLSLYTLCLIHREWAVAQQVDVAMSLPVHPMQPNPDPT